MGNDGGSIPRRSEMVREKPKDEKADRKNQLIAMYYHCALSKRPLKAPVVGDGLGRLYNREAVLEYLLGKSTFGDGIQVCQHIKGLRDIKTLNVKENPAFKVNKKSTAILAFDQQVVAPFVCPVTLKEMNGNVPFEFLWSCGCVFSAQARKELPEGCCVVCGGPFELNDVVPINSQNPGVLDSLRRDMDARKLAEKAKRKQKKDEKDKSKTKHKRLRHDGSTETATLPLNNAATKAEEKPSKAQRTAV
ncbi:Replication termination factor 2 [Coemansia sp. RSA 1813]|nr:Replication termination factor 2 [Coemansia sp. RSA 1646]KAJ1772340.1 Replication termination factor 2 [Coemansia sp. RSA 1843]KAJ2093278.1 Replication termination factor 2 [Coemansia sp. RSA 986]KAJ2213033.1 Replication termination factor 2 [Coemansia sp. RSA 487]KAJ2573532.1 Replication termination factor 2 [Coemansia sp. RSA 1813]